jgi:SAM-dependent methyltransferase
MAGADDIISRGFLPYNDEAPILRTRYAEQPFAERHKHFRPYFPKAPAMVLDVGAGTGVNAQGFAELDHQVVAVEPAEAMRAVAMEEFNHANITWVEDYLPRLEKIWARDEVFDLIVVIACFMHLGPEYQQTGMTTLGNLTKPGGHVCMTLRHGPVPDGRTMYEISDETAIGLAETAGFTCLVQEHGTGLKTVPGVTWSSFVFSKS